MPHLRLYVPEEWLGDNFQQSTGFNPKALLDHLVTVVASLRMPNPKPGDSVDVPMINLSNLKHAIIPLHAHVGGDGTKRFLHCTLAAGNDTPGRTADVRVHAAKILGDEID